MEGTNMEQKTKNINNTGMEETNKEQKAEKVEEAKTTKKIRMDKVVVCIKNLTRKTLHVTGKVKGVKVPQEVIIAISELMMTVASALHSKLSEN